MRNLIDWSLLQVLVALCLPPRRLILRSNVETNDCALPAANNVQATFAPTHLAVFSSPFDGGIPVKSVTVNTRRVVKLMMLSLCVRKVSVVPTCWYEMALLSSVSESQAPVQTQQWAIVRLQWQCRLRHWAAPAAHLWAMYYDRNISLDAKTRP